MQVIHLLEEQFNRKNFTFKPFAKKYPTVTSLELLERLINYSVENPYRSFHYSTLLENKRIVNVPRYDMSEESLEFVDFDVASIFKETMGQSGYFNKSKPSYLSAPDANYFSLLIESYDVNKINPSRLATVMFYMPDDIIDYAVEQLILKPSKTTHSLYDGNQNKLRISEHWNVSDNCLLDTESLVPKEAQWCVGELVGREGFKKYYNIIEVSSIGDEMRNSEEKINIIKMLQAKVFADYPKKIDELNKLIKKYQEGEF